MSSPLAIAAVTYVIKELINEGITNQNAVGLSALNPKATSLPPDRVTGSNTADNNQLNVFLYMARPNEGWRNLEYPSHDAQGRRISNPYLALDLYYMLTAYGSSEIFSDILLGYGTLILHENPVLIRNEINLILANIPPGDDLNTLNTSGIADQIEQIKIVPETLNTEETSRLWTAFGTKYRQSYFYKVTTILIESLKPSRVVLPVQRTMLYVKPFAFPIINTLSSRASAISPIIDNQKILPGYQLVLKGADLKGEITRVLLGGNEIDETQFVSISDRQIILPLPTDLQAGIQPIQVLHKMQLSNPPEERRAFSSNVEAFVLSPVVSNSVQLQVQVDGSLRQVVQLTINSLPGTDQRVTVYLNEKTGLNAYYFDWSPDPVIVPTPPAGTITVPITGVVPGEYIVIVRIDDAMSPVNFTDQTPGVTIT